MHHIVCFFSGSKQVIIHHFHKAPFPSTENELLYCPDLVKSHMVFEMNHSNLNNHWTGGEK